MVRHMTSCNPLMDIGMGSPHKPLQNQGSGPDSSHSTAPCHRTQVTLPNSGICLSLGQSQQNAIHEISSPTNKRRQPLLSSPTNTERRQPLLPDRNKSANTGHTSSWSRTSNTKTKQQSRTVKASSTWTPSVHKKPSMPPVPVDGDIVIIDSSPESETRHKKRRWNRHAPDVDPEGFCEIIEGKDEKSADKTKNSEGKEKEVTRQKKKSPRAPRPPASPCKKIPDPKSACRAQSMSPNSQQHPDQPNPGAVANRNDRKVQPGLSSTTGVSNSQSIPNMEQTNDVSPHEEQGRDSRQTPYPTTFGEGWLSISPGPSSVDTSTLAGTPNRRQSVEIQKKRLIELENLLHALNDERIAIRATLDDEMPIDLTLSSRAKDEDSPMSNIDQDYPMQGCEQDPHQVEALDLSTRRPHTFEIKDGKTEQTDPEPMMGLYSGQNSGDSSTQSTPESDKTSHLKVEKSSLENVEFVGTRRKAVPKRLSFESAVCGQIFETEVHSEERMSQEMDDPEDIQITGYTLPGDVQVLYSKSPDSIQMIERNTPDHLKITYDTQSGEDEVNLIPDELQITNGRLPDGTLVIQPEDADLPQPRVTRSQRRKSPPKYTSTKRPTSKSKPKKDQRGSRCPPTSHASENFEPQVVNSNSTGFVRIAGNRQVHLVAPPVTHTATAPEKTNPVTSHAAIPVSLTEGSKTEKSVMVIQGREVVGGVPFILASIDDKPVVIPECEIGLKRTNQLPKLLPKPVPPPSVTHAVLPASTTAALIGRSQGLPIPRMKVSDARGNVPMQPIPQYSSASSEPGPSPLVPLILAANSVPRRAPPMAHVSVPVFPQASALVGSPRGPRGPGPHNVGDRSTTNPLSQNQRSSEQGLSKVESRSPTLGLIRRDSTLLSPLKMTPPSSEHIQSPVQSSVYHHIPNPMRSPVPISPLSMPRPRAPLTRSPLSSPRPAHQGPLVSPKPGSHPQPSLHSTASPDILARSPITLGILNSSPVPPVLPCDLDTLVKNADVECRETASKVQEYRRYQKCKLTFNVFEFPK